MKENQYDEKYYAEIIEKYNLAQKKRKELTYLKKRLRKKFNDDTLNEEDLEHVVLNNFTIKYRPYPYEKIILVNKNSEIIVNGQFRGSLGVRSKRFIKNLEIDKSIEVKTMRVKYGTELYNECYTGGFYKFNSHRSFPDSFLAIKHL